MFFYSRAGLHRSVRHEALQAEALACTGGAVDEDRPGTSVARQELPNVAVADAILAKPGLLLHRRRGSPERKHLTTKDNNADVLLVK